MQYIRNEKGGLIGNKGDTLSRWSETDDQQEEENETRVLEIEYWKDEQGRVVEQEPETEELSKIITCLRSIKSYRENRLPTEILKERGNELESRIVLLRLWSLIKWYSNQKKHSFIPNKLIQHKHNKLSLF